MKILTVSYLVEDPDLSVDCGTGNTVAVIVKQDALFFGVPSQRRAQLLHFVHGGVQTLLIARLRDKSKQQNMVMSDLGHANPICVRV